MFLLKVKQISGEVLSLELEDGTETTIREVKTKLVHITGIEFERQRLIFGGRVLGDADRLQAYGISEESTIQFVARPQDIPATSPNPAPEPVPAPQFRSLGNGVLMGSITLDGSSLTSGNSQVQSIIGQMMNLAQSFAAPTSTARQTQPSGLTSNLPSSNSASLLSPEVAPSSRASPSELLASAHLHSILRMPPAPVSPTTTASLPTTLHDLFRVLNSLQIPVVNLSRELPPDFDGELIASRCLSLSQIR
jgi:hypothetical protein